MAWLLELATSLARSCSSALRLHIGDINDHACTTEPCALLTPPRTRAEKTLRSTVALTAARGRGKSAALGLAIAGALALG